MACKRDFLLTVMLACALLLTASSVYAQRTPIGSQSTYYDSYSNNPPGAPPNYNLIDSAWFQGVPALPQPLDNNVGGYYIFNDTATGKWYVTNFLYSRGNSLEQFHGSILATMDQQPTPGVNVWAQGFDLSGDLKQNDRWGWVKWPDSIAPNLYEVWWDITIDYAKPMDTGDYRDTLGVAVAGCAIDFNVWSSGHGVAFDADQIYLGDDMTPLSTIPEYSDTYAGITDQYQVNDPDEDPNTSRFTSLALPGATYNANGLISTGTTYGDRYTGSWAYEANGIQFATLFCPPNSAPTFTTPSSNDTLDPVICVGETIYDTLVATDPDPGDILTMTQISGPGTFSSTPSTSPVEGYWEFSPATSGTYSASFEIVDDYGSADTVTLVYEVQVNTAPVVTLPSDTSLFLCDPLEFCVPLEVIDADCDVVSVVTSPGTYSGTASGFDQVLRLNELGATVTQVGGGDPGKILYSSSDFVSPVNSQSGISLTLPNFDFAGSVVDYGSFPNGIQPGNSADHLLGPPTDLTFTTPGSGGPDGGDGDGSIAFAAGNYCVLGLLSPVTTCNGSNSDFLIFTNTDGGGTGELEFRLGGVAQYTVIETFPTGSVGSGDGGVTLDLPDGITFDEIHITCLSGILEVDGIAARSAPSGSSTDICVTLDTTGVYELIATAIDDCGNVGGDTMLVYVTRNSAPVASAGADISKFLCEPSEVCFGVSFSDVDNNLVTTELYSGPGTLTGGQICFTPGAAGVYTFVIRAEDECGLEDYDTVNVTIDINVGPTAVDPDTFTVFQCAAASVCYTFSATDPEGGPLTWSHIAGVGDITSGGEFCFTPTFSGSYTSIVAVSDTCGAVDTVDITYLLTVNSKPVAEDPGDPVNLTLCSSQQVCFTFGANDVDGGTLTWEKLSGDGTISTAGEWCFTPVASGTFSITAEVADSCGAADTVSHTYNVTVNEPPSIALGADTALFLCDTVEICLDYTVGDPNGAAGLVESMVSGFGAIDTAANQICFTPTVDGSYEFIVEVTDSCGVTAADTQQVMVSFGDEAVIACPAGPIDVSLCAPDQVCQLLSITPSSATVTTSFGTYSGGQLCFQADTSGVYEITVIADEDCGGDTCTITFNVEIGQAASINCPAPQTFDLCEADTVCVPVGINGSDLSISVLPFGTYSAGTVCFPADTSGHYEITVVANTSCGADTCTIEADVTINSAPVADDPVSPVDTFLCASAQICYQFAATDADGDATTWSRLSGNGTVSSSGQWCFNAGNGSYTVTALVTDPCGAADTVTLTYNVTVNSAPVLSLGNDTSLFQCGAGLVCWPYSLTDADDNVTSVQILSGDPSGYIDEVDGDLCFIPAGDGFYQFIVEATDACGGVDVDTIVFSIEVNSPPVVDLGSDQTIFQCDVAEICLPASVTDPDGNIESVTLLEGPGAYNGSDICFTPVGSGTYTFVLEAIDACNEADYDTVVVNYTINTGPAADAGADQTLFLCDVQQICWPASCTDAEGNLSSCTLIEGPGTYDGSQICFTPVGSGSYLFVLEAVDSCGEVDVDSVTIDVTVNTGPTCVVPNDTTIDQCAAGEVCLPVYATDPDNNLKLCQIVSGPGSLAGGNWCYTPAADHSVTVVVACEDSCGAVCESEFTVEFDINAAPQIAFGADIDTFLCQSSEICLPFTAIDAEGLNTTTITLLEGNGTMDLNNTEVCFTPTTSTSETFIIQIVDDCGSVDVDTINVTIGVNSPPVADAGSDQSIVLCESQEICWPAGCSDVDGNLMDCIFTGPGMYDGTSICFQPTQSGTYQFILEAGDECGEISADTVTVTVTLNQAPTVSLPADTTLSLCNPTEFCFNYSASDPDGAILTETMFSGYGTIDTAANEICFTPPTSGTYGFVVKVTDSCGAQASDEMIVTVEFSPQTVIECPSGPIDVSLCAAEEVCYPLAISPSGVTITTSFGNYVGGQFCFQADTSGVYTSTVIASGECGVDTCVLTFNVDIGSAAQIECPQPQTIDICQPDTVCVPVTVVQRNDTVSVSPIGYYDAGNVCFFADTSGHYELTIISGTSCGADTCILIADVTINSAPVAVDPETPIDSFLCDPIQFCHDFSANDPDGDSLLWSRLSGPGAVSETGQWCFTPTAGGSYTVTVVVTDPCGAADTTSLTVNISLNGPPVVDLGGNKANKLNVFQCDPVETCLVYTVTDPDDNVVLEELIAGAATLDTAANQFCFTPDTSGTYRFIIRAEDACGEFDVDTLDVVLELNESPVANAGADQTLFLCGIEELCWPASCSDPDDNLDSCYIVSGAGVYASGTICFTPDTAGVFDIVLRSVDDCGAFDEDTVSLTISINSAPVCDIPDNAAFEQCAPTTVSLPVGATDADGNFDHCEIVTGPGSISGGNWTYTPTSDQSVTVQVLCIDSCGATCEGEFSVTFEINDPPVVDLGSDQLMFLCDQGSPVCVESSITDDEGNLESVTVIEPVGGTYSGTNVCFTPQHGEGQYPVIVEAVDSCGRVDRDTTILTIDYNDPPTLGGTPSFALYLDEAGEVCFTVEVDDPDGNVTDVDVSGPATFDGTEAYFIADTSGVYCFEITARDACDETVTDTVCVTVEVDECLHVQIEKTHGTYQGSHETVSIFQQASGKPIGGFDLLIQYDPSALLFNAAYPGELIDQCGWEYFTFRQGADGNCSGCPTGLVRIVAIAETNNGANHPACFMSGLTGSLVDLDFLVTNDRNFECQYVPIRFFWYDCGDNSIADRSGDTLWVSRRVFDFELNEITHTGYGFPGFFGAPDLCLEGGGPGKPAAIRCIDFTNGGIDIVCADSIDDRGDMNLNGTAYEISDAVLYSNYFVYGLGVFGPNIEAATAASDVNGDGIPLSVADLVYMIRVIVGDAIGLPKLDPNMSADVTISLNHGALGIDASDYRVGAMYLTVKGQVMPELYPEAQSMDLQYRFDGQQTRILVYNLDGTAYLEPGRVLNLGGNVTEIEQIELGAWDGFMLSARVTSLPDRFELFHNYPNPFNPTTTIEFALPNAAEWDLTIYNVLGRTVKTISGQDDAGYVKVMWDASEYASGVYFYRLRAGEFTATKKMVLLK